MPDMYTKKEVIAALTGRHLGSSPLLATVSGVLSTKPALVEFVDRDMPAVGLITTKSFQVAPNEGNREPIITEPELGCFGNSVGLRNPGMETAFAQLQQQRDQHTFRAFINVSVSGSTPEEFITLVEKFGPVADLIELNFSCPHAAQGYGASIGCDPMIAAEYVRAVRSQVGSDFPALIMPKLTPNVPDIGIIAEAVMEAGADGISAINTVGPVRYIEPQAKAPILNNNLDGKGGKSGTWIHEEALAAVSRIRQSVGSQVPVIGMGGVSNGAQAAAMMKAGADVVGLGSVFGRVHQRDWSAFAAAVKEEAAHILQGFAEGSSRSSTFLKDRRQMEYHRCTVTGTSVHEGGIQVIRTDGNSRQLKCGPGQFAFIWLPGVGEKPFSIAEADPLTFIVKERGPFTRALTALKAGDELYVRGIYGEEVEPQNTEQAIIIAGGTGLAVVPSLVKQLSRHSTSLSIFFGVTGNSPDGVDVPLLDELEKFGKVHAAADNGIPGRILEAVEQETVSAQHTAFYVIGPEVFMSRAAELAVKKGIPAERVFLSMERPTLCGIGMCGECACGDRLTCQYGTFTRLDFLKTHAPELLV
ncbi:MAG: dihydroorotate dehydrogenase [Spirochaetota bacterium]